MKSLLLIVGFSLLLRLGLSTAIYSGDLNNHVQWGQSILENGFAGSYSREYVGVLKPTYPPLSLYSFTTSVGIYDWLESVSRQLNLQYGLFPSGLIWWFEDQDTLPAFTKITTIVADLAVGVLIYYFCRLKKASPNVSLLATTAYLLNPAVWYVSALWGQIESLPLMFLLLGILQIYKKNSSLAVISFVAMVLTKQTSIIFLPFIGLLYVRVFGLKTTLLQSCLAGSYFWVTYLPFNQPIKLLFPFEIYLDRINTGSGSVWITDHAFNPWAWLTRLQKIPDSTAFFAGLSAYHLGLLFFVALSVLLLYKFAAKRIDIFLATSSISIFAFLVLTKMHERYLAPTLPLFLLLCIKKPILWPFFIVLSVAHFINLYHEWYFPRVFGFDQWVSGWGTISMVISMLTMIGILHLVMVLRLNQHDSSK